MQKIIWSLAMLLTVTFSNHAWAKDSANIKVEILEAVSKQGMTTTPEWWTGLGEEAPATIIGLFGESRRTIVRIRLVEALGYYATNDVAAFLKTQADTTKNNVIRQAALRSLSKSQGANEKEFFNKYLSHQDPQTRLEAALALQRTGDADAAKVVKDYAAREKAGWIVKRLNKASGVTTEAVTTGKLPETAHILRNNQDHQ